MYKVLFRKLNSRDGMTLVELLVVMAILSVVMMAVVSLYIPAHQSTITQTQVSDVNRNLRLAMNVMTRDLLTAGFLEPRFPVVFPDASPDFGDETLTDIGTENSSDFIIRSRAVGDGFARIDVEPTFSGSTFNLKVANPEMLENFPVGAKLRVFGAMNGNELIKSIDAAVSSANRVMTVESFNSTTLNVDISNAGLTFAEKDDLREIMNEGVVIRVKDSSQPTLQTIRYQLAGGALKRIVNGSEQLLAHNMEAVNFDFEYNDQGRVNLVHIKLTGQTNAESKVREVATSVRLRNVF